MSDLPSTDVVTSAIEVKTPELPAIAPTSKINYDLWKQVEIKIGQVVTAEPVPKSEKLLRLTVDFAEGTPRQIVSGIAKHFPDATTLVGKKLAFITNLEPRALMGLESNGMILAVGGGDEPFSLFEVGAEVKTGSMAK